MMNISGFSEEALTKVSIMLGYAETPCDAGKPPEKPQVPKIAKPQEITPIPQPQPPGQQAEAQQKLAKAKAVCPGVKTS
jgi:hypothetical protein